MAKTKQGTAVSVKRTRLREPLRNFAVEMEKVLRENDHKVWGNWTIAYLISQLSGKRARLLTELEKPPWEFDQAQVVRECCEIANFAMKIASEYGE